MYFRFVMQWCCGVGRAPSTLHHLLICATGLCLHHVVHFPSVAQHMQSLCWGPAGQQAFFAVDASPGSSANSSQAQEVNESAQTVSDVSHENLVSQQSSSSANKRNDDHESGRIQGVRLLHNKALEVELLDPEISGLTHVLQRHQELQFSRALALQRLDMRASMKTRYSGMGAGACGADVSHQVAHMSPPVSASAARMLQ